MRTFLFLRCDLEVAARVRRLLREEWRIDEADDWRGVVSRLSSAQPPDLLLFSGHELNPHVRRSILTLRRKGYFVPAAVYLDRPTPVLAHLAGRLHHHGVQTIFGPSEIESGIRALLRRAPPDLSPALLRLIEGVHGPALRLLTLLERRRDLLAAPPEQLAAELQCSRSALYRALRAAGLPPPGSIQTLHRLWPGVLRIVAGGRGTDAAFEAGCPHYASFRKALLTHFGLTIGQVRSRPDAECVLRCWVEFNRREGEAEPGLELDRGPAGALEKRRA